MNIKNIMRSVLAICLLGGVMASCKKDRYIPPVIVTPTLSKTAVNMEVNSVDSFTIGGGVAPYTVTSSDPSKVSVTVNGTTVVLTSTNKTASATSPVTITVTGKDKGTSTVTITIGDPWADAKLSTRLRFQQTGGSAILDNVFNDSATTNMRSYYHVYSDKGKLFGSAKPKYGWSSADGKKALFLEIDGDPKTMGIKAGGRIYSRTNGGTLSWTTCASVQVIQSASGITWIVYKLTDGTQGLVVQPWMN